MCKGVSLGKHQPERGTCREERGPVVSLAEIEALKNRGYNQSQIGEMYGVTRQYISWIVRTHSGRLTKRQLVLEQHFPWPVPAELHSASPLRRLRDHGEYFITNGVGMSRRQARAAAIVLPGIAHTRIGIRPGNRS